MANEPKKTATPGLRFPEFRRAKPWETKKLSDLLVEQKKRNKSLKFGPQDVLSVSGEHGCVNQIELLGRSYAGVSVENYRVVDTGDIVYTKSPLKKNPFGIIKENKGRPGIVSTLYAVYRATASGHPAFLDHYFSRDYNLNSYLQPIVRKGAKNDMKVNNVVVLSGDVLAPQVDEQKRIADCLTSLDNVIAIQGRKVKVLKAHKRGLIQQLFPREGETQPRLRFPEFSDAPEWAPQSLEQLVEFRSGGTPSKENPDFWNGTIPWVSAKDMKTFLLNDTQDHISTSAVEAGAKLAPARAILILTRGMTLLKDVPICVLLREMSFNQDLKALRVKPTSDGRFIAFMLIASKARLLRLVDIAGHGTGKLDTDKLKAMEFFLPGRNEQERIADCLLSVDAQIAAESDQLAALKVHKQALIQQLFPSLESR
ncbi:restriction endonuclease subunit S [Lysobacter sp. A6]|uniref:Restriction endonuclease subunit S n=1 Tax=Noviluteimonas lactosilytica TaxID=2888523 RepID=A0ABS8JDE0_9GAMM|nr:restriction endonuclease subunit S [Lysobacter lactosilyticus]MCC8361609.1 restriction endonuclease subunit S [Lysobacter lactosilyticus]